jgi:hypothetical protein
VQVTDATQLTLVGTINNTGTIQENSAGSTTDIRLGNHTVTLQGGGSLVMTNNSNNRIYGNSGAFQLVNANNTISGAGQLGTGQMRLNNSGSVVATGSNALAINLGSEDGVNNASGSFVAKGAGGLILQSGYFTNNGTIGADNASAVTFQPSAANTNNSGGLLLGGAWKAISMAEAPRSPSPVVLSPPTKPPSSCLAPTRFSRPATAARSPGSRIA